MLYELPKPVQSSAVETLQREYPSAAFVDTSSLFVSDGYGSLYALRLGDAGPAELLATYDLSIPEEYDSAHSAVPFRLHHAVTPDTQSTVVVLSCKHYPRNAPTITKGSKAPPVQFDLWGAHIPLPVTPSSEAQSLHILWHRRGEDVPVYAAYEPTLRSFLFAGSSTYIHSAVSPAPRYEPSPDEIVPVPRKGENLDGTSNGASASVPKPPPYSWTQTSDSVTIAIPLPADTPKEHIKVTFSPRALTVLIEGADYGQNGITDVPIIAPRFTLKPLWDGIHPSTSLWTFDRAAESQYGILALHIDKQHEGTRWPQVFSPAGQDGEEEVPETLDPSELYNIREALEKYTAALRDGTDASGLGLGQGVPSLAEGERDDDVDLSVGKSACLTWVGVDGTSPAWAAGTDGHAGDDAPVQVLSTPFPGAAGTLKISLVAKHGLDGATFTLQPPTAAASATNDPDAHDSARPRWEHTSTYSALSFVLASKRDTRFVHHVASEAVFAFESGARDLGGNVYIYRGVGPKENWAKQTILRIGGGDAGSLLGVGLMKVQGKIIVLCLCEGELVVLHDVL